MKTPGKRSKAQENVDAAEALFAWFQSQELTPEDAVIVIGIVLTGMFYAIADIEKMPVKRVAGRGLSMIMNMIENATVNIVEED